MKRHSVALALFIAIIIGLLLGYIFKKSLPPRQSTPPKDNEQIVVDPRRHTIIIHRPTGDTVTHLPDKPTIIDIWKDGTASVNSSQYGFETRPFVGLGFSNDAHISAGADVAYWGAFDLGCGLQWNFHMADPRMFVAVSYTIQDNLRIGVTIDHKKNPGLILSVRI